MRVYLPNRYELSFDQIKNAIKMVKGIKLRGTDARNVIDYSLKHLKIPYTGRWHNPRSWNENTTPKYPEDYSTFHDLVTLEISVKDGRLMAEARIDDGESFRGHFTGIRCFFEFEIISTSKTLHRSTQIALANHAELRYEQVQKYLKHRELRKYHTRLFKKL